MPRDHPGPLQTVRLMLTALAILFLGVSVFAYAWGGQSPWAIHSPAEQGDEDAADLLRQLRLEGMDCQPRAGRAEMFDCIYRHSGGRQEGRAATPRATRGGADEPHGPLTRAS